MRNQRIHVAALIIVVFVNAFAASGSAARAQSTETEATKSESPREQSTEGRPPRAPAQEGEAPAQERQGSPEGEAPRTPRPEARAGERAEERAVNDVPLVMLINKRDANCKPCQQLEQIMSRAREQYASKVRIELFDVTEARSEMESLRERAKALNVLQNFDSHINDAPWGAIFDSKGKTVLFKGDKLDSSEKVRSFSRSVANAGKLPPAEFTDLINSVIPPATASSNTNGNANTTTSNLSETPSTATAGWFDGFLGTLLYGLLILFAVSIVAFSLFLITRLQARIERLEHRFSGLTNKVGANPPAPAPQTAPRAAGISSADFDRLSQQLQQQQQQQQQETQNQFTRLQTQIVDSERRTAASLQAAIEQLSSWIASTQMHGARLDGDGDMETTAAQLERYREPLHQNAARVEPLTTVVGDLSHHLQTRPSVAPGLISRVQKLYEEIGRFELWAQAVDAQLEAIKRGSTDERRTRLQNGLRTLQGQLHEERVSVAQYVRGYSRLLEENFPAGSRASNGIPPLDLDQLRQFVDGTTEFLMDWFSDFSQLQGQVWAAQAADASIDAETLDAFTRIQRTARDVLNSFDIQPEEIQVGQTLYDRNLHDFSMPRQGTPYPPQTIVEVQRAGFRRLSSGEVLRRPQVVVASSGVV
jgi:molecular chaperone GrpE (heat shock protein)